MWMWNSPCARFAWTCRWWNLDVPDQLVTSPDEVLDDPSVVFRSISKETLIAEAKTKEHQASHFPFNPYCPICKIACMKQKRHGRTKGRGEDVAKQWTTPIQGISTDTMFVSQ